MTHPITGISSMATRQVLAELAGAYEQRAGWRVAIESVGGVDAAKRVQAGEAFDVVVLASDAIDKLIAAGHVRRRQQGRPGAFAAWRSRCAPARRGPTSAPKTRCSAPCWRRRSIGYSTGPSGVAADAAVRALGHRRRDRAPHRAGAARRAGGHAGGARRGRARLPAAERADAPATASTVRRHAAAGRADRHHLLRRPVRASAQRRGGARACSPSWLARRPPTPSAATAWNRPEHCEPQETPMIIDMPRPLHHRAQGAGSLAQPADRRHQGPGGDAEGRRPEDQRRRAARDASRPTSCAKMQRARQRPHDLQPARQLHGPPHRRLRGLAAPGRRSATSSASASASCSPTTSSRRRCCRRARASTRRPASPSW